MAEGGGRSFTPSVYKGSEEVFDVTCDPCSRRGTTSEALDFCSDCSEYFCPACTKDHLKFGITSGHKVVQRSEAEQVGQGKTSSGSDSLPTERCETHTGELMTTYCADHGAVACNTCVSMEHRLCDNIYYIPSVSGDPKTRQSLPRVKTEMSESLTDIKSTRLNIQRLKTVADDEKMNHVKHINDNTKHLIKHAHALEKAAINDVSRRHKETTNKLDTELASLDKAETRITTRMKNLDKADTTSDSQVFVDTKLGAREAKAARQLNQSIKSVGGGNVRSMFVVDKQVVSFLSDVNSLVKVIVQKPYKVTFMGTYSIRTKGDKESDIADICELPDGTILMTDYENRCIKTLNKAYKVTKCFKVPSNPWGICHTSQNEIAVTLVNVKQVQFVDIRGSWKLTTSFTLDECCRGIACIKSRNELVVSCGGLPGGVGYGPEGPAFVGVYNMSGSLRQKIQLDGHGRHIFSVPYHIALTNNDTRIHITDKKAGLITFDHLGNILSTFSDHLQWALGLCALDDENLLVSGKVSNNVLQINTDGRLVAELLRQVKPCCLAYSRGTSTMAVIPDQSDAIKVFDLLP